MRSCTVASPFVFFHLCAQYSEFSFDWLRSGFQGSESDAWYISNHDFPFLSADTVVLCDVDFYRQRVQLAVRGVGVVLQRGFDPHTQAPLWPCAALRRTGTRVTLLPAAASEIDRLRVLTSDDLDALRMVLGR